MRGSVSSMDTHTLAQLQCERAHVLFGYRTQTILSSLEKWGRAERGPLLFIGLVYLWFFGARAGDEASVWHGGSPFKNRAPSCGPRRG